VLEKIPERRPGSVLIDKVEVSSWFVLEVETELSVVLDKTKSSLEGKIVVLLEVPKGS